MNIVYFLIALGLSVWLWIIRQKLLEKGWETAEYWAFNFSIGAVIIAALAVSGKQHIAGVGDLFVGVAICAFLINLARRGWHWVTSKIGGAGGDENHMRGAKLRGESQVAKALRGKASRFSVGEIPIPVELETRGFLLAGVPGTGKSQTLTRALDALRADGARAIVADVSGIYASRYFDVDRDIIVNPFDARSVAWSPLAEIETVADIPALCKSLIPDGEGEGRVWSSYAQTALDAILEHCFTGGLSNAEIFRLVAVAPVEELRGIFAGTPAQPLVAEGNEKMFASVRGSMVDALGAIRYLDPAEGVSGFSIRKHITSEAAGWIFLSYQPQHRDALRSLIACCLDISARAVLSLPPDLSRRVIFALDELPLLGKIQSVVELATNGRRHGAVIFAGLQTVAQVRAAYGPDTSQTLLACLGSWLVLRVSDAETAEYMSRYIGEEEKTRKVQSGGTSKKPLELSSSSDNWQEQVVKDRVVLPSELQALPDLRGIFNLAGPVPAAVVTLRVANEHKAAEAFVAAPPRKRQPAAPVADNSPQPGGDNSQQVEHDAELPY